MNKLFIGRSSDMNIGNGKTVSAIREMLSEHLLLGKTIVSNIKIMGVPYTPFNLDNIFEILDTKDTVILFDEIHAILFKNHRISTACKAHVHPGMCFEIIELFRQVRKRNITTLSTAQTFADVHFQMRTVMQEIIICEKFHVENNTFKKCQTDICPTEHGLHYIKQTNHRSGDICYIEPEPYFGYYDSSEVVKGWV